MGTLTFRWRVDCEKDDGGAAAWDRLAVFTNGVEAARIDGLSEIGIFFRMYFPMMKSTYAASAVIIFMNSWNAYMWPRTVMKGNSVQTMPMLIANMSNGYAVDYGMLMLGVLFCSLPTIIVFFVLQKQFAEGITGSVK